MKGEGGVTTRAIREHGGGLTNGVPRQIVDKTIMEADTDRDGKISFEEFTKMVENTDVSMSMTLGTLLSFAVHVLHLYSCSLHLHPLERQILLLTLPQTNSSRYPDRDS